jgi:hypothetical protein
MAVNYNILAREGPANLYEGFVAGQQAAAQNALAQQKMAQERDLMSMRRQEFQANLESSQADRRRKAVAEKTALFRDRVLRAPTPQAARDLIRLQHSDPDLGPVIQQFGSLDQDLADIPDDPTGFESWRQREAMGAAEFINSQASEQRFQALLARARGGQPPAAAPTPAPVGEVVAEPMAAPRGVMREIAPGGAVGTEVPLTRGEPAPVNTLAPAAAPTVNAMAGGGRTPAQIRAEIDTLSMSNDPRAVRMVQTLQKEYEASMRGGQDKAPQIKEIGVATKTNEPVYFDARTDQQFTIGTDPSGKQVRKPYTGGVNRATSSVTATATSSGTPVAKSLSAPVGQRAEASLAKAEGAVGMMENANMIREALNTGNVIAGPLAGVRTKFAQVLELAGAGDKEKLINTRSAIQGLASLTLESRAELKGQGQVTDTETKLLERARSGNIEDMTVAELQQVVNVSQRLANRLWSGHQNLLKTMSTDPAATDSMRYYQPTAALPSALGEGKPKAETDKRTQGLDKIFKPQPR